MVESFVAKGMGGLKTRCLKCSKHIDDHIGYGNICPGQSQNQQQKNRAGPLHEEYLQLLQHEGVEINESPCMNESDVLIVVDMQNDFLKGGPFEVSGGNDICPRIVDLIEQASKRGAMIIATRDYHPIDHISFTSENGPFPTHCVQGSLGSCFEPSIGDALTRARDRFPDRVKIVFKGFHNDIDSFGAFPYSEKYAEGRITGYSGDPCCLAWTGAFELMCSNQDCDINAPPDVMAVTMRQPLGTMLKDISNLGNIFVCGLALDYCILDTLVTAAEAELDPILFIGASRAVHVPSVGEYGSGFLTNPRWVAEQIRSKNIKIVN